VCVCSTFVCNMCVMCIQHDGGDDGDNRDELDDNQLAAAIPKPPSLNHPPAALRGQDDPVQDKNNKGL
jgi:hypothetical protein